jgi:nitrogen fixation NifU-like protein
VSESSTDDLRDLYRELILDHARSPRHFGRLAGATHSAEGLNPLCGDKLQLYLQIDGGGKIADATFEGSGCAISVASASLLTDSIIGMESSQALDYAAAIIDTLKGSDAGIELGKLRALEGVREFPSRVKCATLAWHAMKSAIRHDIQPVSTEHLN